MNGNTKLKLFGASSMAALAVAVFMNVCAIDHMEQQVIDMRLEAERGGFGASTGGQAISAGGVPGEGTGVMATGWNGTTAEVLFVQDAVHRGRGIAPAANAPLSVESKPKPQGDASVSRMSSRPPSLNVYAVSDGSPRRITRYIYDRLLLDNPDQPRNLLPRLAVDWEVSEDRLVYTFHLRQGVQFADGRPFTSKDVKFTYDVLQDPEVQANHYRAKFEDVESVTIPDIVDEETGETIPDPYKIVVTYSKEYWKGLVTFGLDLEILNAGWYEDQIPIQAKKLDITDFSTTPGQPGFGPVFNKIRMPAPGTGPYYLDGTEYDTEGRILELKKNPFYWGMQITPEYWNFKKLNWLFIKDDVSAFQEFLKEKFDVMVVDHDAWEDRHSKDETVNNIANHYVYDHTGIGYSVIVWTTRRAPFDDPLVRKAMSHLVNQDWILETIEKGHGSVAVCPTKRVYESYNQNVEPYGYSIEKAKALLAEAGWADTNGDGVLDKNGQKLEFTFKLGSPRQFYTMVTGQLNDACKQVGIKMNTEVVEWATYVEDLTNERDFDAV